MEGSFRFGAHFSKVADFVTCSDFIAYFKELGKNISKRIDFVIVRVFYGVKNVSNFEEVNHHNVDIQCNYTNSTFTPVR